MTRPSNLNSRFPVLQPTWLQGTEERKNWVCFLPTTGLLFARKTIFHKMKKKLCFKNLWSWWARPVRPLASPLLWSNSVSVKNGSVCCFNHSFQRMLWNTTSKHWNTISCWQRFQRWWFPRSHTRIFDKDLKILRKIDWYHLFWNQPSKGKMGCYF